MNPINWTREHQLALVIAMLIGAGAALAFGYLAHSAGRAGALSFTYWIRYSIIFPGSYGAHWWALFGALAGAGVVYVRRLTST